MISLLKTKVIILIKKIIIYKVMNMHSDLYDNLVIKEKNNFKKFEET